MSKMTITAAVVAQIVALAAEGKSAGVINMKLSLKNKKLVDAVLAGNEDLYEIVEEQAQEEAVLEEKVQAEAAQEAPGTSVEGDVLPGSKLGQLLEQQQEQVQVAAANADKAEKKPRAKKVIDDTKRDVNAVFAESIKTVFLTARRNYSNMSEAAVVQRFLKKETGAKVQDLLGAADLQAKLLERAETDLADEVKAKFHNQYVADGWKVVSTCPKSKLLAVAPTPEVEQVQDAAPEVEEQVVETPVLEVQEEAVPA